MAYAFLVGDGGTLADLAVGAQLDELLRTSRMASRILERTNVKAWLARLPTGA
jgi:glutathione S-transferase